MPLFSFCPLSCQCDLYARESKVVPAGRFTYSLQPS